MKKQLLLPILLLLFATQALQAQTTAIPDTSFEKALIELGIDSDSSVNGQVLTADINTITDLKIINYGITNLAGIEDFDSLQSLNCSNNRLSSIDLGNISTLIYLNCSSNLLTGLDVTSNKALQDLNCQNNLLTAIDISENIYLLNLDISFNEFSLINTSENFDLESFKAANNRLSSLTLEENDFLKELDCSNNQITYLDVTKNTYLKSLSVASNQLVELNTGSNELLEFLDVSNNQISSLNLTNNLSLTNLSCSKNQLPTLYLGENISLSYVDCSNNHLDSINLELNTLLQRLICSANQLQLLDVSENVLLETIDASQNILSAVDFSSNDSLTNIDVSTNQLRSLNIKNGNNEKLSNFKAIHNPDLLCIQVDDISAIGSAWMKDSSANYKETCISLTYIPDDNFEQALIDLGLDSGTPNDYVPTGNIDTLRVLKLPGKNIELLTGIQDFISLDTLDCSNNGLSNLNIGTLGNLAFLNCASNNLVDLNLINNPPSVLTTLDATGNSLLTCISVDNVAAAIGAPNWVKDSIATYNLDCNGNKTYIPDNNFEQALIDLGLDKGSLDNYVVTDSIINLKFLDVSSRNITDLTGIGAFESLETLDCSNNNLFSLDISSLDSLKELICFSNYLSALDVTNNDSLRQLNCGNNRLANLDVTHNAALLQLVCDANDLKELDLSKNPSLTGLNCSSNFIMNAGLDVSANDSLKILNVANNKLTAIDISSNHLLEELNCSNNYLTAIDLSLDSSLKALDCSLNKLASLDVSKNQYLTNLNCGSNQLDSLDLTNNKLLRSLNIDKNRLIYLDISGNDSLRSLSVSGNELSMLDISKNLLLNYLKVNDNHLPVLEVSSNDSLVYLSVSGNEISTLNTNNLGGLQYLNCGKNKIDSLDISANKQLLELHISGNSFESVSLDSNKNIRVLDISNNDFASINLAGQDFLVDLNTSGNQLKTLLLGNNTILKSVNCSSNELERLNVQNGNNDSLTTFNTINNPNLFCIEVDDPNNIGTNWQKDSIATYNVNCHYDDTYIPDDNFEKALSVITGQPDNNDNYILTSAIDTLQSLNINGRSITDLTGIQDFVALQFLNVQNNSLESLDLSNNQSLRELNASSNQLDSLDLSNNKMLEVLELGSNQLTSLVTDSLGLMTSLNVDSNQLISLTLKNNHSLISVRSASNQLTNLSVNNGNNAVLLSFDATGNDQLFCIEVDDRAAANAAPGWQKDGTASYSTNCHYHEVYVPDDAFEQALIDAGYEDASVAMLDNYVPDNKILTATSLYLKDKGIKDMTGLQAFVKLAILNIDNNNIDTLDVSSNLNLEQLYCANNGLSGLNVSGNIYLTSLSINHNPISDISLHENVLLKTLSASNTNISKLSLGDNPNLVRLTASNNDSLLAIDIQNGNNNQLTNIDVRFSPMLNCILVDNVDTAYSKSNWLKDATAFYRMVCADDDNDGVPNDEDHCLTTPFGDQVDIFGCSVYTLPANNFNVLVSDETCRSSDNGMVNITALKMENYKATIEVDGKVREYNFTDSVEIRDIRAGTYELCITINDKPTFRNCYTIVIRQPVDLSVIQRINPGRNEVTLELSGGKNYTVELNGEIFKTTKNFIQLKLTNGLNRISVKTDKHCQGVYEQKIFMGRELAYYPNPFEDQFTIYLGNDESKRASVNIYSYSGQLVWSKVKVVNDGMMTIKATRLAPGLYTVAVNTGKDQFTFKIVKK